MTFTEEPAVRAASSFLPRICDFWPCRFTKPEYVSGPQTSGPERIRGCSPLARSESTLVKLMTRVGFCFVPGRGCRSLRAWFRISNSTHDVEIRNEIRSQRKLNCALSVDFLWKKKITDRTNPGLLGRAIQVMKVRSFPLTREFKLSPQPRGYVFNGEFDSGSERTLAAWIRHASRARFLSVAIQEEV